MIKYYRIKQFFNLNILKTLYINFKLLPIKQAIKIPILVNYRTEIVNLKGSIKINCRVRTGMIQFNNFNDEFLTKHIWRRIEIIGDIEFNGVVGFGAGTVLFVRKGGKITFGNNILIGGRTKILCEKEIKIGNNVRIAFESQIMDSNFHYLRNIETNEVENCKSQIFIGNNVWIGNRTSVMKNTKIPDFTTVSSNSILNRDYTKVFQQYSIIGGSPVKLLKVGFERIIDLEIEKEYDIKFQNDT